MQHVEQIARDEKPLAYIKRDCFWGERHPVAERIARQFVSSLRVGAYSGTNRQGL
jgi:hypothetical protein